MTDDTRRLVERLDPPSNVVSDAIAQSMYSPCQSKRGAVVFLGDVTMCSGCNHQVLPFTCDSSDACKARCRKTAVHAEQYALAGTRQQIRGCDMLHVKTVRGELVPSGQPSCVECSKLMVVAGIAGMWLYHSDGWYRYDIQEFHRLSVLGSTMDEAMEAEALSTPSPEPVPDVVCTHGTALDVHCCNCHSGFVFDKDHECPVPPCYHCKEDRHGECLGIPCGCPCELIDPLPSPAPRALAPCEPSYWQAAVDLVADRLDPAVTPEPIEAQREKLAAVLRNASPAPREAIRVLAERAARILDRYDLTDQIHGLGRDVEVFVRDVAALHAQDQGDTP